MVVSISSLQAALQPVLTPIHPRYLPFPLVDLYGAMRLSSVANWMATGAFDPPSPATNKSGKGKKGKAMGAKKERATVLQEVFGILVVVFGGETFLALCTNSTPSWLVNPSVALLFGLTHVIQTRTPIRRMLPAKPSLALELLLALPDAIGRTLLLTRFSVLPLLHSSSFNTLPPTPSSLILVPFILAVPFASLIFSATSFFSPRPHLSTPMELQPGGWMMVDAWAPVLIPAVFLTLIGPVEGWDFGMGWGEDESVIVCMIGLTIIFALRAVYNFGYKKELWSHMLGLEGKKKTE
ncbi:hypothetical protein I314_01201 [Cryptococcus bacillisporus CA1873]|uniref:Uncharacterized protein n=1 Tax=Cryptococcus bacillisporus CA1873 TaxID=1296111 RepID=A0ABR5BHX5_CRYGA|nr:hypothetical protein I314_01201 [Cryptococcus bacillisporus CA1873]|eukprot:KIR68776.1 hypothetical protein I314_01201 [Cryptococcus gattii CA1873]